MITILTRKEFNEKYLTIENLPQQYFIIIERDTLLTVIDNTLGKCHIEIFSSLKMAIIYCLGYVPGE